MAKFKRASAHYTQLLARVILRRDGKLLLQKRIKTKGGGYSLVGGKVDVGESPRGAAIREAAEEIGVVIDASALRIVRVIYRDKGKGRKVHFIFEADEWEGEPRNLEPKLCLGLLWVSPIDLPKGLSPASQAALNPKWGKEIYIQQMKRPEPLRLPEYYEYDSEES